MSDAIVPGTFVTHHSHGGQGRVMRVDADGEAYVAWFGTCVEDQVNPADLEVITSPPPSAEWDGKGVLVLLNGGTIQPCPGTP